MPRFNSSRIPGASFIARPHRLKLAASDLLAVALSVWLVQGEARAEAELVRLAKTPFVESFVGNAKVSGNVLVGVQLGRSMDSFDPRRLRVPVSHEFSGRRSCVQIASRDGRYTAENLYDLPSNSGALALEMPSRYLTELTRLSSDDIAVMVRDVADCRSPGLGRVVPTLMQEAPAQDLIVLVNPGFARADARLLRQGREIVGATRCVAIEDQVRIAFSARCTLSAPVPFAPGSYQLELSLREATSRDSVEFAVLIP